jgi:hypothetical protein
VAPAGLPGDLGLGAAAFRVALGLTSDALAILHRVDTTPARWVEVTVLMIASGAATINRYVPLRCWVSASRRRHASTACRRPRGQLSRP